MARGMIQTKLTVAADLNIRTVKKIEAGHINMLVTTFIRIQTALNCPRENSVGIFFSGKPVDGQKETAKSRPLCFPIHLHSTDVSRMLGDWLLARSGRHQTKT